MGQTETRGEPPQPLVDDYKEQELQESQARQQWAIKTFKQIGTRQELSRRLLLADANGHKEFCLIDTTIGQGHYAKMAKTLDCPIRAARAEEYPAGTIVEGETITLRKHITVASQAVHPDGRVVIYNYPYNHESRICARWDPLHPERPVGQWMVIGLYGVVVAGALGGWLLSHPPPRSK
jgi:hypothetical protein